MYVNLQKARISTERKIIVDGSVPVEKYTRLSLTFFIDDRDYGVWCGAYSSYTISALINHLRGNVEWNQRMAFDDTSRYFTADPTGITIYYYDNMPATKITYPGHALAHAIEEAHEGAIEHGECNIEITAEEAAQVRQSLSPHIEIVWHDDAQMILDHVLEGEHAQSMRGKLDHRIELARSFSDGDLVVLNIAPETGFENSLHTWITKDGNNVFSGGILYHKVLEGYQSHS